MLIADWEERRPFFSLFFFLKKKKGSKVPRVLLFTISRCCPLKADRYMLVFFYLSVKSVDGGQRAGRKGGGERRRRRRNWKKRNQRSERWRSPEVLCVCVCVETFSFMDGAPYGRASQLCGRSIIINTFWCASREREFVVMSEGQTVFGVRWHSMHDPQKKTTVFRIFKTIYYVLDRHQVCATRWLTNISVARWASVTLISSLRHRPRLPPPIWRPPMIRHRARLTNCLPPSTSPDSLVFCNNKLTSVSFLLILLFLFLVDDHFAKALGETWLKLQSETKEKEGNSDSQPGSPLPSQRQGLILTWN